LLLLSGDGPVITEILISTEIPHVVHVRNFRQARNFRDQAGVRLLG
jgi:hypothetical protein